MDRLKEADTISITRAPEVGDTVEVLQGLFKGARFKVLRITWAYFSQSKYSKLATKVPFYHGPADTDFRVGVSQVKLVRRKDEPEPVEVTPPKRSGSAW